MKIITLLTLLLPSFLQTNAFVGLYSTTIKGKKVIILGDMHSGNNVGADIKQADQIIEKISTANFSKPVECVVELPQSVLSMLRLKEKVDRRNASTISYLLETIIKRDLEQMGKIRLAAVEERTVMSDFLPQLFSELNSLVLHYVEPDDIHVAYNLQRLPVAYRQERKKVTKTFAEAIKLSTSLKCNHSLNEYLEYLNFNRNRLSGMLEKYGKDETFSSLLTNALAQYDKAAAFIKEQFKHMDGTLDFAQAFLQLFAHCNDSKSISKRHQECFTALLSDTDYLFADCIFIETLFNTIDQTDSKIVLQIVGQVHAESMAAVIKRLGKPLTHELALCNSQGNLISIPSMPEPLFRERFAQGINELIPGAVKPISETQAKAEKIRTTLDGNETNRHQAPLNCDHCKNTAQNLKKCGQCKAVYYCNAECQKKAWAEHKKRCVAVNTKIAL